MYIKNDTLGRRRMKEIIISLTCSPRCTMCFIRSSPRERETRDENNVMFAQVRILRFLSSFFLHFASLSLLGLPLLRLSIAVVLDPQLYFHFHHHSTSLLSPSLLTLTHNPATRMAPVIVTLVRHGESVDNLTCASNPPLPLPIPSSKLTSLPFPSYPSAQLSGPDIETLH